MQNNKTKIIVAPLNWGIGHATRCVSIINDLLKKGFEPIIATDGNALTFLNNEFPLLKSSNYLRIILSIVVRVIY